MQDTVAGAGLEGATTLTPITDQRVIDYATDFTRQQALLAIQTYEAGKKVLARWPAVSAFVPTDDSPLMDGNTRAPLTGAMIWNVYYRTSEFVADLEANGNAKLLTLYAIIAM